MRNIILRLPSVIKQSGLSRSNIYLRIQNGLWTSPVSLGGRCVGWPVHEVNQLNLARIQGKSDEEVFALVISLEEGRKNGF